MLAFGNVEEPRMKGRDDTTSRLIVEVNDDQSETRQEGTAPENASE